MAGGSYTGTRSRQAERVVAWLHRHGEITRAQMVGTLHIAPRSCERILTTLRSVGLVHTQAWRWLPTGQLYAVYGFGPGRDAARPRGSTPHSSRSAVAATILEAMGEAVMAVDEIARHIGRTPCHVGGICLMLHREGRIHIAAQLRNPAGGQPIKLYRAGPGEDAAPPPRRTQNEAVRQNRERQRRLYGDELYRRIRRSRREGGAERIVIEGKTIYERRRRAA